MNKEKNEYEKTVLIDALGVSVIALQTYRGLVRATIHLFTTLSEEANDPLHQQYVDSYTKLSEIDGIIGAEISENDMVAELLRSMEEEE